MTRSAAPTEISGDLLLANLVDEITQRLNAGEDIQIEEYTARYPDVAETLTRVWETLNLVRQPAPDEDGSILTGGDRGGQLGDFRIVRELGRGGMGVVYEAEQISLGRRVALKVLPFAAMLDKQQLKRFKNEARAAATLDHSNIVAVHSVGEERGVHYYAMQLVEGQSLAELIATMRDQKVGSGEVVGSRQWAVGSKEIAVDGDSPSDPPPPSAGEGLGEGEPRNVNLRDTKRDVQAAISTIPAFDSHDYFRTVARLGMQAAHALDHAHQNGIVHRDVKPGNLLVDVDGSLFVTDFGLARIETGAGMTMTGDLLGTLAYMSPEQALAKRVVVDHRTDVYSLGVTLYELLTLQPPYLGADRQELLKRIAFDEPRRPRQINHRVPEDLETIVSKAIEKVPDDRYATAQELADDLQRFLADQPIRARRPTVAQRIFKWARRHNG